MNKNSNDEAKKEGMFKTIVFAMVTACIALVILAIITFLHKKYFMGIAILALTLVTSYHTLMLLVALVYKDYREKTYIFILCDLSKIITYIVAPLYCITAIIDKRVFYTIPMCILVLFAHTKILPWLELKKENLDK